MKNPLVSVIIPTKNSAQFMGACLKSIASQTYKNIEIIVVDNNSTDQTKKIVSNFSNIQDLRSKIYLYNKGPERSAQRIFGVKKANGEYLVHIDSDMELTPTLVSESITLLRQGFDALVIPERSFGSTFWAKCKSLEKSFYEGNVNVESIRIIKKDKYRKLGGHDPGLVFSEDKDLDLRARTAGLKIGRTRSFVLHNEGKATLIGILSKKMLYSHTSKKFADKHPKAFSWQANILNRYIIFLNNFKVILNQPFVYLGLFLLKTLEFSTGTIIYLLHSIKIINKNNQRIK